MENSKTPWYVFYAGLAIFLFGAMAFVIANLASLVGIDIGDIGYVCQFGPICPMAIGSMLTLAGWALTMTRKAKEDSQINKTD